MELIGKMLKIDVAKNVHKVKTLSAQMGSIAMQTVMEMSAWILHLNQYHLLQNQLHSQSQNQPHSQSQNLLHNQYQNLLLSQIQI